MFVLIAFASRYCSKGVWDEEDVSQCNTYEFMAAFDSVSY